MRAPRGTIIDEHLCETVKTALRKGLIDKPVTQIIMKKINGQTTKQ